MRKSLSILLCLLMLALPLFAQAALRMPDCRGTVTDDANVLSAQTTADLTKYAERLEDETGITLRVALVHFLDGAEVQSYAQTLFDLWELENDHLLVLGAAGEDSFATVAGRKAAEKLGANNAHNLLFTSSAFGTLFASQQYDAAFAAYCTALSDLVSKQLNENVRLDGLFGQTAPSVAQQVQSYGSEIWNQVIESIADSSEEFHDHFERREREENGLTAGGWIVLIILIMIATRRNRFERRRRRERSGCLGWIIGLFGINLLMDLLRGKRR